MQITHLVLEYVPNSASLYTFFIYISLAWYQLVKHEYYNVQRMDWFCSIGLYYTYSLYLNSSQKLYYLVLYI